MNEFINDRVTDQILVLFFRRTLAVDPEHRWRAGEALDQTYIRDRVPQVSGCWVHPLQPTGQVFATHPV
jgi:hypothetical protein